MFSWCNFYNLVRRQSTFNVAAALTSSLFYYYSSRKNGATAALNLIITFLTIKPFCDAPPARLNRSARAWQPMRLPRPKERSPDLNGHRDANLICVLFQPECCVFCLWASSEAAKPFLEFTRGNWKFHHQSTSPKERITEFALKSAFPFPRASDNSRGE